MIFIALLFAVGHGTMLPILTVQFGDIIDQFRVLFQDPSAVSSITDTVSSTNRIFLILSFVVWVISFIQLYFALASANLIGNNMRTRFFDSLIRQQPAFYDKAQAGVLTNLVVSDINLIQAGIGDKLATATHYITTFVAGIIVGLIYGWKMTLLVLAVTPLLIISGAIFGNASAEATGEGLGSYGEAGGIASETFSLIRTVTAFQGQKSESHRYESALKKAYKAAARAAVISGIGLGVAMFLILSTYGLAFWFGSTRVNSNEMSAGDVLLVFFALTLGASSLGTAGPAFKSFAKAQAAAPRVFDIIDAVSDIDPLDNDAGIIPEGDVHGHITFTDVDFSYNDTKSDDNIPNLVLQKFNLNIPPGTSEALVGKSGCGKSTVARLIQRHYDPSQGSILLDGVDLRELNVRWLRAQIGVVSQMPSLFMMSIRDNIALGAGLKFSRDKSTGKTTVTRDEVTEDDIIAAAKLANAHNFIMKLPEGYDTLLGERGAMLSGGQKQRVCIARALVRNPKILVLDESTASLDTESERLVQEALERASSGRTTLTIAHRLSTVRNSDSISCIQDGQVIERGSHDFLMATDGGFYRGLFELQTIERQKLQEEKKVDGVDENEGITADAAISKDASVTKTLADSSTKALELGLQEEDKEKSNVDKGVFVRALKLNSDEWPMLLFGTIGAIVSGVVWPIASIALTNMIELLAVESENRETSDVVKWSLAFVALGGAAFVGNALQHGLLGISGELLTMRVRSMMFKTLLRQEMGFFDMENNSLGSLTTLLSSESGLMKGLTGDLLGVGINVLSAVVCSLIIAFIASWRLTLVILVILPGVVLGGYFEMQASAGFDTGARKEFDSANAIAAEAVDNIGTVRSLGVEDYFLERFSTKLGSTWVSKARKDFITAFAYGFSEFCQYLIWYATFKAGSDFIEKEFIDFSEMMQSSMALLFGAITLGNVAVFAPDVGGSNVAATKVFRLLDRNSEIDPLDEDGDSLDSVEGDVSVKGAYFEYPRRPDVAVLRGLTLEIEKGRTLAIVGTSGHGKSTVIGLLERFYNIRKGTIEVDGHDVSQTNVKDLRWQMGLVQQEPELFNRSVFDNIAYGLGHDDGTVVTQEAVEKAAKLANAHEFIVDLPQGYNTSVGARGESLSGGQRQRVAIARGLVRNPKILLLDEATSALDGASERLVQDALDKAGERRTAIVVAHRLSTIRNADTIAVVRRGRIVESGTHTTLLRKNGAYAKLIENQLTEV